jgi:hypothetical protein
MGAHFCGGEKAGNNAVVNLVLWLEQNKKKVGDKNVEKD